MLLIWQGNFTESLKIVDITPTSKKKIFVRKRNYGPAGVLTVSINSKI